jgi:hypothetical protein
MVDLAAEAIESWEHLNSERGVWLTHWQEIANYMLPNRADYITQRTPGQKLMQWIYDSTPLWALEQFAAGLHSLLTSPTLPWFGLKTVDDRLNADGGNIAWLQDAGDRMYSIFNGPTHNFASQSGELYMDTGSIGTAVMAELESARSGILFSTRHLKECCLAENEEDRIDTCVRRWEYTAKQAVQAWGTLCGPTVLAAYDERPSAKFAFLHSVKPRHLRDVNRADARNKPFESVYVSVADRTLIAESGFNEFPYLCPRFSKRTGETYGRGPGMTALPDVKMLNQMVMTVLKAAQKVVDPPLQLPDDGFMVPIKTTPGGLNFYRAGSNDRIEPLETKGQVQLGIEMVNALRQQIIRSFYVEWMSMPSDVSDPQSAGKGITATYVLQNRDEKMRLMSPMLARLQSEFLGPLIDRTFAIMWRHSVARRFGPDAMFARPPASLSGAKLRVEYVSPIAIAQRGAQLDVITRLVQTAIALMQLDPQAASVIDAEGIIRLTGRLLNAPAAALKTVQQVQDARDQKAQADAAMNQHMQAASIAKTAKDGGAAVNSFAQAGVPPQQLAQGVLQGVGAAANQNQGAAPMQQAA